MADYNGKGNVGTYPCEDRKDQMWEVRPSTVDKEYFELINKESGECLDVANYNGRGDVGTYRCERM